MAESNRNASIKKSSLKGGAITISAQAVTVVAQLLTTAVLARLLTPHDYGLIAMVLSVTAFAGLFKDLGLSAAAIQRKGLSAEQKSNLFWLNSGFGFVLSLAVAGCAPLVVLFYGRPELLWVTYILAANFFLAGVSAQPFAMLTKEMRFGSIATISTLSMFVNFIASICLAVMGYSYWALVWGSIAGNIARLILVFCFHPFVPGPWYFRVGTRKLLGFGANVTGFNFVNYFARNLDNILIGRFLGTEALGVYSKAYQLLMFPIINLRSPINIVTFPSLSKLQDKPPLVREYYFQSVFVVALLTMPLMAFLHVHAEPIIHIMLGDQWLSATEVFEILAIVGLVQPVVSMRGSLLLSLGMPQRHLRIGTTAAILLSVCFAIGINWGVVGVAWAYVFYTFVAIVPLNIWTTNGTPVHWTDLFRAVATPILLAACFWVLAYSLQSIVQNDASSFLKVVYGSFLLLSFSLLVFTLLPSLKGFRRDIFRYLAKTKSRAGS